MTHAVADLSPSRIDHRVVDLPAGTLQFVVEACHGKLDDLIGFAARANPRRAFLFLSKVLGKHYPARPAAMVAVHQHLASLVPATQGPVVFVGMAETATGLGQGVFESWRRLHSYLPALYLQTTRYRIESAPCLTFEESHSHAPRVFLHLPQDAGAQALLRSATQVVLIDDELSTGNTFVNLTKVLQTVMSALSAVHVATICDFMGEARRGDIALRMGRPCTVGAAVSGHWQFESNGQAIVPGAAAQCGDGREVRLDDSGYGRLGRIHPVRLPLALVERIAGERVSGPTLVLGTGEFMHAAFVLARALDASGVDVVVQATTRSPILLWGDVSERLNVQDPYGEGVPNYLYNVRPEQYRRVLICHETEPNAALQALAEQLAGRLIQFKPNDYAEEIPVR